MAEKSWFYCSFATADRFLGACVVEARSAKEAPLIAGVYGCNPGGEAMVLQSPNGSPGPYPTYRLLTREELGEGVTIAELLRCGVTLEDALVVTDPRLVN